MSQPEVSLIAQHTFIQGELHLDGPTVIAGRVEGSILAQDRLEIAPDGIVEGDIQGVLIDIQGTIKGNVTAARACRLGATARVTGELRAANLAIAEGACFIGQVHVGGEVLEEQPAAEEPVIQAVTSTINRLESLAAATEEIAQAAATVAAVEPAATGSPAPAPAPTVRVLPQTIHQTLHRSPKIIKAR